MAERNDTLIELMADIVSAYVSRNSVPSRELPELMASVSQALTSLAQPAPEPEAKPELVPAVPVKKSVTRDYIISLEDGRKLKSMKRYLAGLGMTPDEYRTKWGLPRDYPMVASSYTEKRSAMAKSLGLGRKRAAPEGADNAGPQGAEQQPQAAAEASAEPKARGRRKKVAEAA